MPFRTLKSPEKHVGTWPSSKKHFVPGAQKYNSLEKSCVGMLAAFLLALLIPFSATAKGWNLEWTGSGQLESGYCRRLSENDHFLFGIVINGKKVIDNRITYTFVYTKNPGLQKTHKLYDKHCR